MKLKHLNLTELMELEALFRERARDVYREDSAWLLDLADQVMEEIIERVVI